MIKSSIYSSPNTEITASSATIKGQIFEIEQIEEVEVYDDRPKAVRWAKIGLVLGIPSLFLGSLMGWASTKIGLIVGAKISLILSLLLAGFFGLLLMVGLIMLIFSGGALLIYRANPLIGAGLILHLSDGYAEIIKGLSRQELGEVSTALQQVLAQRRTPKA